MTGRNPNVFYEVGYAHALGKPTFLLTQKADDIPFDLKHFPHIIYDGSINNIRKDLTTRIKWFIENKDENVDYNIGLELYYKEHNLSNNDSIIQINKNVALKLTFTIFNNSSKTFKKGDFRLVVITSDYFCENFMVGSFITPLPDRKLMHSIPIEKSIFPSEYSSFELYFKRNRSLLEEYSGEYKNTEQTINFRIFSAVGTQDYFLTILEE